MSSSPRCALVISTYNAPVALRSCLDAVARQQRMPDEVIVADDGSGPETRAVVESYADAIPIHHVWHRDDGFRLAEIRNRAIAASTSDYIVLLDGDTVPHRRFVDDHLRAARPRRLIAGTRCGLSGFHGLPMTPPSIPALIALWLRGQVYNDCDRGGRQDLRTRTVGLIKGIRLPTALVKPFRKTMWGIHGGNLAFWRSDAIQVNGFDEQFVGWGHEDREFCVRMRNIGVSLMQLIGHAICYHINHPTRAETEGSQARVRVDSDCRRCEMGIDRHLAPITTSRNTVVSERRDLHHGSNAS